MPTDTALPAGPAIAAPAAARARPRPRRKVPNPLTTALLALFLVFFVLPVLWLLLAATKTDQQLVRDNPLSFGSWGTLRANWDALTSFQDDAILLWLRNSALYSGLALVITVCVGVPAGYAMAMTEFRGRRTLLVTFVQLAVSALRSARVVVPSNCGLAGL
jgi:multiple sugar transport system permease protein